MGDPATGRPTWVVRPGVPEVLLGRCHLELEDGTEVGDVDRLPPDLPLGIHDLAPLDGGPATTLVVSPGRCHLPDDLRSWGVVAQVPTTRSRRSWGIGDLADVRSLAEWIAGLGGDLVALSPLHSPTPVHPMATSPYFPSSRRWRNPLLIRVDEVPGGDTAPVTDLGRQARALLAEPLVQRDACWALQRAALEHIWAHVGDAGRDRRGPVAGRAGRRARGLGPVLHPRRPARGLLASLAPRAAAPRGPGRRARRGGASRTGSGSTPGSSCSWTTSSTRPGAWGRASCRTWPSVSIRAGPTRGCGRTSSPTASAWARPRMTSSATARRGACRHGSRGACATAGTAPSRTSCAGRSSPVGACGSTT